MKPLDLSIVSSQKEHNFCVEPYDLCGHGGVPIYKWALKWASDEELKRECPFWEFIGFSLLFLDLDHKKKTLAQHLIFEWVELNKSDLDAMLLQGSRALVTFCRRGKTPNPR